MIEFIWHHTERIRCPECVSEQDATVEHTFPHWSRVHTCASCGYIIMESEWERVEEVAQSG